MKRAVFYANTDGIANFYHGSGIQTRVFLESWAEIKKQHPATATEWDAYVGVHDWRIECPGYAIAEDVLSESRALADLSGTTLLPLPHDGTTPLWSYPKWEQLASAASQALGDLADRYDQVLFMGVDTPYCMVEEFCREQLVPFQYERIVFTLAFHTSALVPGQGWLPGRQALERDYVRRANESERVFITSQAPYFDREIERRYGAKPPSWLQLGHGISLRSRDLSRMPRSEALAVTDSHGIPTDRPIVLHFGRADAMKRIPFAIEAVSKVKQPFHFVLIASPSGATAPATQDHRSHLESSVDSFTFIDRFTRDLPRALCGLAETKAVLLSAKGEPVGQIPQEVACWGVSDGPVVVAPDHGGYVDQVQDGITGLTFDVDDSASFTASIERALDLPPAARHEITGNLRNLVRTRMDASANLRAFLTRVGQYQGDQ